MTYIGEYFSELNPYTKEKHKFLDNIQLSIQQCRASKLSHQFVPSQLQLNYWPAYFVKPVSKLVSGGDYSKLKGLL